MKSSHSALYSIASKSPGRLSLIPFLPEAKPSGQRITMSLSMSSFDILPLLLSITDRIQFHGYQTSKIAECPCGAIVLFFRVDFFSFFFTASFLTWRQLFGDFGRHTICLRPRMNFGWLLLLLLLVRPSLPPMGPCHFSSCVCCLASCFLLG